MKLTTADIAFSRCIRERADWTCEKCNYVSAEGQATKKDKRMQCSHFIGRKHKVVRYDKDNAFCLCSTCHAVLEESPGEHTRFVESKLGEGLVDILIEKKHQVFKPPGGWKKTEKEMAKHYRDEFNRMLIERASGVTGRLEFESYL